MHRKKEDEQPFLAAAAATVREALERKEQDILFQNRRFCPHDRMQYVRMGARAKIAM